MAASANCPTASSRPFEYCARMRPPSATPTRTNCAAAVPFWLLAETAEGWPNCVSLPALAGV